MRALRNMKPVPSRNSSNAVMSPYAVTAKPRGRARDTHKLARSRIPAPIHHQYRDSFMLSVSSLASVWVTPKLLKEDTDYRSSSDVHSEEVPPYQSLEQGAVTQITPGMCARRGRF